MSHLEYRDDLQPVDTEHGVMGIGIGVTRTGLHRIGVATGTADDRSDIHLTAAQMRALLDEGERLLLVLEALDRAAS